MKACVLLLFSLLALVLVEQARSRQCCNRGEACWPSEEEWERLRLELDPQEKRSLVWGGLGTPRPCGVPLTSEGQQPLYGYGKELEPLYTKPLVRLCGDDGFCEIAVRNEPYESDWEKRLPTVVAWPTTVEHTQAVVRFARQHSLCVCMAGTGHDFLNRHSCNGTGIFIRTALIKDIEFDDVANTVRLGSGITFSEAQYAAGKRGQFVSSGWASTVGITGWSIGGGHGPFAPSAGLGVDNIVAVELVLADGSAVVASEEENADLLWALRGGGGGNWGVITHITVRTHTLPRGGVTQALIMWIGSQCGNGLSRLHTLIEKQLEWSLTLDANWSGLTWISPEEPENPGDCPSWSFLSMYVYRGPDTDSDFKAKWTEKESHDKWIIYQNVTLFEEWWTRVDEQPLEPIISASLLLPSENTPGGVPSVLVSRNHTANGSLLDVMTRHLRPENKWGRQEMYQCITGNIGSPQPASVSTSGAMRTALYHFLYGGGDESVTSQYYSLGEHSYFSESAYVMPDWRYRYWGKKYDQLLAIKRKYDPEGFFYCRHCVGADDE